MRLTPLEINQIIQALSPFLHHQTAKLYLYGSRVHDHLKGGDIDLLLSLDNSELIDKLSLKKHEILADIKNLIGEQHIDLKIINKKDIQTDPFLQLILPTTVLLHQWS